MGIIKRLKRITLSRIEGFLASLEDPRVVIPQLMDELRRSIQQAGNAEAKALTAVKSAGRKLDELNGRIARLQSGAQLAVSAGDSDTARRAIAEQIASESRLPAAQAAADAAGKAYDEARQVRIQLQEQLQVLTIRQQELMDRWRIARQQGRSAEILAKAQPAGRDLLDQVARMEELVSHQEAMQQVMGEIRQGEGLGQQHGPLDRIQREDEIQRRLDELKRQLHPPRE